jgi:hypothetical protein
MKPRYILIFLTAITIFSSHFVLAQASVYLTAVSEKEHHNSSAPNVINTEPAINIDANLSKAQQRKQLMAYLKDMEAGSDVDYNSSKTKRLYYMASFFTRLRLYPLAMKCFLKTIRPGIDSISKDSIPITANDDSLLAKQENINTDSDIKSKPISDEKISETFNDGKKAIAFAMIFHVKQPVRGKKQIFKLANTGHTFITLIKYNSDSTYAAISFGFYPKKDNPLSATPLIPSTSSTFKDDSEHNWDEVLGKFISKRRFNKILALTQQYHNVAYHLSKNNCTDFGLKAAALAGLDVWDTKGSWPLGSGNNPAVTGQSLLEGKFDNADTGDQQNLLIANQN